jgi:hypothetical protein
MRLPRTAAALAGALVLAAAGAQAADAKTIHLLSRSLPNAGGLFDPNNNPIPDDVQPSAGSYFIGVDRVFKGSHARHGRKPIGWDHIICTILDPSTFTAKCDAQIALRGGVLVADRQTVSFSAATQTFKITDATGKYRRAKGGTVTSRSIENSDDSDLVVRY